MRVLLSINPEHAFNILEGSKRFEFRRKLFARRDIKTVIIYCTMPIGKIIGEFDIAEYLEEDLDILWDITADEAGISYSHYHQYFSGKDKASAMRIGEVRHYSEYVDPRDIIPKFTPPQSYMYVTGAGNNISRPFENHVLI